MTPAPAVFKTAGAVNIARGGQIRRDMRLRLWQGLAMPPSLQPAPARTRLASLRDLAEIPLFLPLLAASVLALGDEALDLRLQAWRDARTAAVAEFPSDEG